MDCLSIIILVLIAYFVFGDIEVSEGMNKRRVKSSSRSRRVKSSSRSRRVKSSSGTKKYQEPQIKNVGRRRLFFVHFLNWITSPFRKREEEKEEGEENFPMERK